jgi:DNA-binding NtrC family response regulator
MIRSLNIMVVDDEPIVGNRLKRLLEKDGHTVHAFTRGSKAVEAMVNNRYDIVITDLKMGKVDGIMVLEHASSLNPPPRVIVISGLNQQKFSHEASIKGAFAFVKPFRVEELREVIRKVSQSD